MFFLYSQRGATITKIDIFITPKEKLHTHQQSIPIFPTILPLSNDQFTIFCLYEFAHSEHFI